MSSLSSGPPTSGLPAARPPKLLDQVRQAIRLRHYSRRTEEAYVTWIHRYILFHRKRHPREMGAPEIAEFLSHLATKQRVSASTQNQALSALLFLYRASSVSRSGRCRPSSARGRPSGCLSF